jgi:hypothetical protein
LNYEGIGLIDCYGIFGGQFTYVDNSQQSIDIAVYRSIAVHGFGRLGADVRRVDNHRHYDGKPYRLARAMRRKCMQWRTRCIPPTTLHPEIVL